LNLYDFLPGGQWIVNSVVCLKPAGEHGDKWKNTKVFPTYKAMLEDADAKPTAAFIGLPPKYHGALEDPDANIEVCCNVVIIH